MNRRVFILGTGTVVAASLISCDDSAEPADPSPGDADASAADATVDAIAVRDAAIADACTPATVQMHDTYAQALYFDGSLGPLTGIIEVDYVVAGATITLDFWHGHGGQQHRYTLDATHFEALKRGERVTLGTSTVDGHSHMLFIDPVDETYRVPGSPDVPVSLGC